MNIREHFKSVDFDEYTHTYTVNNERYISVTTLLNRYKRPFDAEKMSAKVAQRDHTPQPIVKKLWEINRDLAAVKGTEFHLYIESMLKYGHIIMPQTGIDHKVEQFNHFWNLYKNELEVIDTEFIVADFERKIAGTVDCLVRNKNTGKYRVLDWKQNQEIKKQNRYGSMLRPLTHLDDCKFNMYSLQLAMYTRMLRDSFDLDMEEGVIVHFPDYDKYTVMYCRDMKDEIERIFADHR